MKNPAIENKIESLLSQMTVKEKVGQLHQIKATYSDNDEIFEMLRNGEIGSFILAQSDQAGNHDTNIASREMIDKLQRIAVTESRLGIPVIYGRDVIHGHKTVLPIPLAMAASFNNELIEKGYRNSAKEAALDGIQWSFTPMLDVSRDPRWGRCIESPGEDPFVGMQFARSVVEGLQGDDLSNPDSIASCAKHYIGYGAAEGGRDYHHTEITDYTLRNFYLKAFKAAVDSGLQTVMNSFNEIGGQPTVSSHYLLTEVLKEELGFDGFVVSDWEAVMYLVNQGVARDKKEAAMLAVNAGLDMDMIDGCYHENLEQLVNEGKVSMEVLDEAVRRILRVKFNLGLFENPYIPRYEIDRAEHEKVARQLSAESIVLLKNNGILPLSKDKKVALLGPMVSETTTLMGSWAIDGKGEDVVSIATGIKNKIGGSNTRIAYTRLEDEQLMSINWVDTVVLCLGESRRVTGEANSLAKIEVPKSQVELAKQAKKSGKPVVAVMCFGRPVALEEIEPYCDAIVYSWHLGTQAGNAIADVLFGDINPSGKLPMTMPRCTGQIPIYYNVNYTGKPVNGYYGWDSCKNYHDCKGKPMYQFGFGLSYSDFQIGDLELSEDTVPLSDIENGKKVRLKATIKNNSDVDGKEVVQLYVRDVVASMNRPIRELRGYQKVSVDSNGSLDVEFEIGFDELYFYNGRGKQVVEPGEFELYVGNSCYATEKVILNVV